MNCKPGDLAWIAHQQYLGHFVKVLHWAVGHHTLPDGYPGDAKDGGWVCEKASGKFRAPTTLGAYRKTPFACIGDQYLRPIRDNDGEDEMLRIVGKPERVEV